MIIVNFVRTKHFVAIYFVETKHFGRKGVVTQEAVWI